MSLSRFARPNERNCEVNGGKGDYFDLLGLPDEMIEHVFSFLSVEDRMRMRLNQRLNMFESTSKYYVERVDLDQDHSTINGEKHVSIKNRSYPLDFFVRIAQNTSIGDLYVYLRSSGELNSKFHDLIKEFKNIRSLVVYIRDYDTGQLNEIMSDSLFLDLTGRCSKLELKYFTRTNLNISSEAVHQVYKNMSDGSTILRKLTISARIGERKLNSFLNVLGIAYRNGRIISSRNIEANMHHSVSSEFFYVNIFDGLFDISFILLGHDCLGFNIEMHDNLESLNSAKNAVYPSLGERTRMDVYSE